MIKITKLTCKNFLSIGNATQAIRLDQHGLTLVLGSNADANGGVTRNGAGKTTILQAISVTAFGKPLTRVKADNLVNNINQRQMLNTLEWERGNMVYRVERGRKPNVLKFFINDKERVFEEESDHAQGENRHTQAAIEEAFGMSHMMFSHLVALNTYTEPFLLMKPAAQREVMEELIGALQLSRRAEVLKKLLSETKEQVRDEEARLKAVTETNTRVGNQITMAETSLARWDVQQSKTLSDLRAQIEEVGQIDFDAEIAAFDRLDIWRETERSVRADLDAALAEQRRCEAEVARFRTEAKRYEDEAGRLDPASQVRRLEGEIARKEADAERHALQAAKLREELAAVEADIANPDAHSCRSCGQGLSGTDHLTKVLENLGRQQTTLQGKLAREEREQEARLAEIDPLRIEIAGVAERAASEAQRLTTLIAEVNAKIEESKVTHDAVRKRARDADFALSAIGERPAVSFASRDEVYQAKGLRDMLTRELELAEASVNPFAAQVASLTASLQEVDRERLEELQTLQSHQDLLMKLLTKPDSFIRKKIVDQNLAYLNGRVGFYLGKLGLPHEVKFQPDLTVEITHLGRDFDFPQLSRGESNRVIMATSWAFRDVWESLNETMNLYFIDEILDQGMDAVGAESALAILTSLARDRGKNIYLISHRDDLIGRIDRTLLVRKTNNFSTFEEDVIA